MTSQYRRGRDFEYAARNDLREHGYEVVRSAGSKSKIDLIAIKPGELLLIQCKMANSRVPTAEWNQIFWTARTLDAVAHAILAIKVPGRVAPEYWRLTSSVLDRSRRVKGTHYEPWSPDPLGA